MEKVTIRAVHSFFPSHPHPCARSARAGQCRDHCPLPPVTWRNWTTGPLGARKRQPLEKPAPVRRTPWPLELPSLRSPDLLPHFHPSHRLPSTPLPPIPFSPAHGNANRNITISGTFWNRSVPQEVKFISSSSLSSIIISPFDNIYNLIPCRSVERPSLS